MPQHSAVTPDEFRAAFRTYLELRSAASTAKVAADLAEAEMLAMSVELTDSAGVRTLGQVFADDPAMLTLLHEVQM